MHIYTVIQYNIYDTYVLVIMFFTFYMYNTAAATVLNNSSEPHVQRVMPSGMDEGAPAVLGTVAF